jgi:hypothetical protein
MQGHPSGYTIDPGASGDYFNFHFVLLDCKSMKSMFKHQKLFPWVLLSFFGRQEDLSSENWIKYPAGRVFPNNC